MALYPPQTTKLETQWRSSFLEAQAHRVHLRSVGCFQSSMLGSHQDGAHSLGEAIPRTLASTRECRAHPSCLPFNVALVTMPNGCELSGPAKQLPTENRALAGSAAARDCVISDSRCHNSLIVSTCRARGCPWTTLKAPIATRRSC